MVKIKYGRLEVSYWREWGEWDLLKNTFWTKCVDKDLKDLPFLKAWDFMKILRKTPALSLFWLLKETTYLVFCVDFN